MSAHSVHIPSEYTRSPIVNFDVGEVEAELQAWHRDNPQSWRLAEMLGLGPVGAALLVMKIPDPTAFRWAVTSRPGSA